MQNLNKDTKLYQKAREKELNMLAEVFAMDGTVEEACFYAGISPGTYREWMKNLPHLKDHFEQLRNNPVMLARKTVMKAIQTNPEYAFKYLERKKRKEFGNQVDVNTNLTLTRIDKIEMIQPHVENYIEADSETVPSVDEFNGQGV